MEPETRTYFLANVCHVCKSKNTPYCCEICNMIFYCSPKHRRENWFDHSELCWAVKKICDRGRTDCLWRLYDEKDFTKFRHEVADKCTQLLKRSLKSWEFEMIYYPRICNVCRDFDWKNLSLCKGCEFIYTCEKGHFRKDHAKWCEMLRNYSELIINQTIKNESHVKPFEVVIEIEFYKSMTDIFHQSHKFKDDYKNVDIQNVLTSEILTYPLTVLHGLRTINVLQNNKLEILFIGAEIQAEIEPLAKWEKYLFHCVGDVEYLSLKFLGPELRETSKEFFLDLCETCREQRKIFKIYFINGTFYHEYSTNGTEQPNLICAFNSGMYRKFGFKNENSWEETIQKLFTRGSPPVLITEYTFVELKMVLERIRSLCEDVVTIAGPDMNPFASMRPGLNIISEDETPVIFKNYFYTILQRK